MKRIVAEVKTHSPFGWESSRSRTELFEIAQSIGSILSIHTDPRWGGSFEWLKEACEATELPVLAKGIHAEDDDIKRALDAGAEYVLVVGRIPGVHLDACWFEPNSLSELARLPRGNAVVWNARDLADGKPKRGSFTEARHISPNWLVQASFIETVADIHPGADAVLVGTHLPEFAESLTSNL